MRSPAIRHEMRMRLFGNQAGAIVKADRSLLRSIARRIGADYAEPYEPDVSPV